MRIELRERYVELVNFLGLVLGPSYEIALHDLAMGDKSVIAIANGHITNRGLGSPLSPAMLEIISSGRYKEKSYEVNYVSISMKNKALRSSTIYIKDNLKLVGLLCITFDDSRYQDISRAVMGLCHPDNLLKDYRFERLEDLSLDDEAEIVSGNNEDYVDEVIGKVLQQKSEMNEKIRKKDRVAMVKELKKRGILLIKGAVPIIAKKLNSSEATIYRYINELEEDDENY